MCSRIFVTPGKPLKLLLEHFGLGDADIPALYNVAPTEAVPVIFREDERFTIAPMRWWLHPSWSPEPPNQKYAMFNARIETVMTSRAFQGPIRHKRAIMPVSGFVEFKTEGKRKHPFYVAAKTGDVLAIAALWECWQNEVWSTALITQAASKSFTEIHDRMPLTLGVEQARQWMNPETDIVQLLPELRGASSELRWSPIDPRVNNSRNKQPAMFV